MVRTRAENTGRRAVGAKAPRKQLASSSSGSSSSLLGSPGGKEKHMGGNPVRWTPIPTWQKGIGTFFGKPEVDEENSCAGENTSSNGNNIITNGDCCASNHTTSSSEKERVSDTEEITEAE